MGELALLIPILALCIPILAVWSKHKRELAEIEARNRAGQGEQTGAHVAELEDRLRVLERIITDKGYDVATQIEALRETRKVDALLDGRDKETLS